MGWAYNPQTGDYEETPTDTAYFDGGGNLVDPVGEGEPSGTGEQPPVAPGPGPAPMGDPDIERKRSELRGASYPGPWDDASVNAAYARTVGGGNASPSGPRSPTGPGGTYVGGTGVLDQINAIAYSQAQLQLARDQFEQIAKPTAAQALEYQRKEFSLKEEIQRAQTQLQRDMFGENRRQFDETFGQRQHEYDTSRGDQTQQFDVNRAMDIWNQQGRLANQNAENTGVYYTPDENPTLPGHYLLDQYRRSFEEFHGRPPTPEELQAEFLRNPVARGADPNARPWSNLVDYSPIGQDTAGQVPRPGRGGTATSGSTTPPTGQPAQPTATPKPTRTGDKEADFRAWGDWLEKLRKEHPDWDGYRAIEETDKDLGWDRAGNDYKPSGAPAVDLGSGDVQRAYMGLGQGTARTTAPPANSPSVPVSDNDPRSPDEQWADYDRRTTAKRDAIARGDMVDQMLVPEPRVPRPVKTTPKHYVGAPPGPGEVVAFGTNQQPSRWQDELSNRVASQAQSDRYSDEEEEPWRRALRQRRTA